MAETKIFAVAGKPVMHSKSPVMFNAAFEALSLDATYTRLAATDALDIVQCMRGIGIAGMNITSPFKEEITRHLDGVDEQSRRIGAVNTVVNRNGELYGFNTDWIGVRDAFVRNNIPLSGRNAVVVGAGGAARAAVFALLTGGARVTICNRTRDKAEKIARHMGCRASSLDGLDVEIRGADILVSCLPGASEAVLKPGALGEGLVVLDANYGAETALAKDSRAKGYTVIDGLEWLLYQGGAAFTCFTGCEPPLLCMRSQLYGNVLNKKRNMALIGFMATGKTTVAGLLGTLLNRSVVDVDGEIAKSTGCTVADLFAARGEHGFRSMERESVAQASRLSNTVVACGGGAVLDEENRAILRNSCCVTWLWAGVEPILARAASGDDRPLLRGKDRGNVETLLKSRIPFYALTADMIVRTDNRTAGEIAERIGYESNYVV